MAFQGLQQGGRTCHFERRGKKLPSGENSYAKTSHTDTLRVNDGQEESVCTQQPWGLREDRDISWGLWCGGWNLNMDSILTERAIIEWLLVAG